MVQEPSILVCNSVGGVVGLRAAIDRYVRTYICAYERVYWDRSSVSASIKLNAIQETRTFLCFLQLDLFQKLNNKYLPHSSWFSFNCSRYFFVISCPKLLFLLSSGIWIFIYCQWDEIITFLSIHPFKFFINSFYFLTKLGLIW